MSKVKSILLFNQQKIRRHWNEEKELWYFSVVDIVAALTGSVDPFAYWRKLKERLKNEGGNETVTKCHALKMFAKKGDKILDTHLGSGTIAIACHNAGFDLTACEIDKNYYNKALHKIQEHLRQGRLEI